MTAREFTNELREKAERNFTANKAMFFTANKAMLLKASDVLTITSMLTTALDALDEILDKDCPYGEGGCFSFEINRIASKAKLKIDGIAGGN